MHAKNAAKNIAATWGGQIMLILVKLLARRYFLRALGADYLGVDSLFVNIISFLSMAELGIGSAINYSLYKPLVEHDVPRVKSLMRLYRKAYWIIGGVVIGVGLLLIPVLPFLVNGGENIEHIDLIYAIFVANTGVSYFFSYKSALLIADQKDYVYKINHYIWQFLMYGAQIVLLKLTGNYFAYLLCQFAVTVLENASVAHIADKRYPFLREKDAPPLPKAVTQEIWTNTTAMVLNRIGNTLVNSTDNILISGFIGVTVLGIYSNYTTVTSAITSMLYQGIFSMVAILGNAAVESSKDDTQRRYGMVSFLATWLYGWCSITLFCLLTPFVSLWYGPEYTIDPAVVFVLCMNLYISGQRCVNVMHVEALGLYRYLRYKGIIEALINLVASIILLQYWGLIGVLIGTTLSNVAWSSWKEVNTVFHKGLHTTAKGYYLQFLCDSLLIAAVAAISKLVTGLIPGEGALPFLGKAVVCTLLPNALLLLAFHRRWELQALRRALGGVIGARRQKRS